MERERLSHDEFHMVSLHDSDETNQAGSHSESSRLHSIPIPNSSLEPASSSNNKRVLPLRTLACVSVFAAGIQFGWALQLSLLTPYVQTLGISHEWASFIWLCGPVSGLLVQPIVGVMSDNSKSKYGKRKPFIFLGTVSVIFSILLISYSAEIGYYLGDKNLKFNETKNMACALFIMGFWFLDLSNNAVQGPGRALLADITEDEQKYTANAFFSFWISIGNILGYTAGSIGEWHKWFPFLKGKNCEVACANLKAAFILAILFLTICAAITLLSAKENDQEIDKCVSIELMEREQIKSFFEEAVAEQDSENLNTTDEDNAIDYNQRLFPKNEIQSDNFETNKEKIKFDVKSNGVEEKNYSQFYLEDHQTSSDTIALLGNEEIDKKLKRKEEARDEEIGEEIDTTQIIHSKDNESNGNLLNKEKMKHGKKMNRYLAYRNFDKRKRNENNDFSAYTTMNHNDNSMETDNAVDFGNGLDSVFINLLIGVRSLSKQMTYILIIMALSWLAWFPFLLYDTDWMGREIYFGQVEKVSENQTSSESQKLNDLYESGVRLGAFGLLLNSVVQAIASVFLDTFCKKYGPRNVWAGGNFLLSFGLCSTFLVAMLAKSFHQDSQNLNANENFWPKFLAVLIFATLGIPFAITVSIPFSLTAELTTESGGGQGLAMGILNLAVVLPQIFVALCAGSWDKLFGGGNEPAFLAGSFFAFIGALFALKFVPEHINKHISIVSHSSH